MNINDYLKPSSNSISSVSNIPFSMKTFEEFILCPADGYRIQLTDVLFEDCRVQPGTFFAMAGVEFQNVKFVNFQCGDVMRFSSEVILDRLKIAGFKLPKMIWIKPENIDQYQLAREYESITIAIDLSEYTGKVNITGIPVNKIIINPACMVKIDANLLNKANFRKAGIPDNSYWKSISRKITVEGSASGVFSIPDKKDRIYNDAMRELESLTAHGFI